MGQRVYILSKTEYCNILGVFTNIRQCRKFIETLKNTEDFILNEIRLNEPNKNMQNMTKLLYPPLEKQSIDQNESKNVEYSE